MAILDNKLNIRSFGRINGRSCGKKVSYALDELLPKYSFDPEEIDINNCNYLEIGFGYGESLAKRALTDKNVNYIGCETYSKGVANLIDSIEKDSIKNIEIFNGDARILLDNIPDHSIDKIFILYPDPWPKKRHNKRRIINEKFLELIHKKLKKYGILFFTTDVTDYADWVIEKVKNSNLFIADFSSLSEVKTEPQWWVKTKYQEKAIKEFRDSYFIEFTAINTEYNDE